MITEVFNSVTMSWFLLTVLVATFFLMLCSHMAQDWIRFLDSRADPELEEEEAEDHAKLQIVKDVMSDDPPKKPGHR